MTKRCCKHMPPSSKAWNYLRHACHIPIWGIIPPRTSRAADRCIRYGTMHPYRTTNKHIFNLFKFYLNLPDCKISKSHSFYGHTNIKVIRRTNLFFNWVFGLCLLCQIRFIKLNKCNMKQLSDNINWK